MNKEFKYINDEIIQIKDEKGNLIERKINCNDPKKKLELENKIETITNIISNINKKIKSREEYIKFVPKWIKMHSLFPIFTLILIPLSCITGWVYTIYSFILSCTLFSIAIIITSIIAGIISSLTKKDINGLINKLETSKEMKIELEKELLMELSKEIELSKINDIKINKPIKLEEDLSIAESVVLSHSYSEGFKKREKRLIRTKNK